MRQRTRSCRCQERPRGGRTTALLVRRKPPFPPTLRSVIIDVFNGHQVSVSVTQESSPEASTSIRDFVINMDQE